MTATDATQEVKQQAKASAEALKDHADSGAGGRRETFRGRHGE